ncbi:MAG: polymer-forming cytoskeletal protein [Pseudomonadota bacterium]
MFSRNSDKDPVPTTQPQPLPTRRPMPQQSAAPAAPSVGMSGGSATTSIIGSDLAIIGSGLKIVAQQTLQVDGEVQGDVLGSQIIVGPTGKVTGLVNAERVQVNGAVFGTIRGVEVTLSSSAVVEGDIFHQSFVLEQGAHFEGRSRRPKDRAELVPDLAVSDPNGVANGQAQPVAPMATGQAEPAS